MDLTEKQAEIVQFVSYIDDHAWNLVIIIVLMVIVNVGNLLLELIICTTIIIHCQCMAR